MSKQTDTRGKIFLVLQDIRLGNLSEYEATLKLQELGVVIKGQSLGSSHPHLADYYTVEDLI